MFRLRAFVLPTVGVLALVSLLISSRAPAQQQSGDQQSCITSVNKAARGVLRTQSKEIASCIKKGATGVLAGPAIDTCLTADADGRVAKADAKTTVTITSKCATPPNFGLTTAAIIKSSAIVHDIRLADSIFGDSLGSAVILKDADAVGAKCQARVQKGYEKVLQAQIKEFEACKKVGLKNGTITSQGALANCLGAIHTDPKLKISKAVIKLADTVAGCAGVNMATAFPGDCSSPGFADCAEAKSLCSACLFANEADDLAVYCDQFDNGVADASCVDQLRCGDGILEAGEDCDDDNNIDGDCCSSTCVFEPNGQACPDDGNVCTDEMCDGAATCLHPNNTGPCEDSLFCTGTDTCAGGSCSVHSGDPCTGGGECGDLCNEAADNCFDPAATACTDDGNDCTDDECDGLGACAHPNKPAATPCTDDGNVCTDDECDGAGVCTHPNNTAPCDDGIFCNGADTCSGGTCSVNAGDPCPGPDGDANCSETCDESADACTGADPDGSACADDGDVCTFDECATGACTHPDNTAPTGCDPRYVSPGGSGVACSKAAPCSLVQGLSSVDPLEEVRADQGTYTLSDDFSIADGTTLVGGFDSTNSWQQTAGCVATEIVRDATNPDGGPGDPRIVALDLTGGTGFAVECLRIATDDASGAGTSTYGVHLDGASSYTFTDVTIEAGNAASGASGSAGTNGAGGSNGVNGTAGLADGSSARSGGSGGAGGGAGGGTLGGGASTGTGSDGGDSSDVLSGGGGGGGGGGGFHAIGGDGGQGGGVNGGANQTDVGTGGAGGDCVTGGVAGIGGGTGANGTSGSAGAPGGAGSQSTYWVPGGQGATGTDGTGALGGTGGGGGGGQDDPAQPGPSPTCVDGVGAGGGGGGGGGAAGGGGSGGSGGGSAYAVYLVNNGAGGVFNAGSRTPGAAGAGGLGGTGGTSGTGGTRGTGGAGDTGVGAGGDGGFGGNAGSGGAGGAGVAGESIDVVTVSGTPPTINP